MSELVNGILYKVCRYCRLTNGDHFINFKSKVILRRVTTFLENLEKSGNYFKSGKSQGKQAKLGKSQGSHDCAILSASTTNSNFTYKNTQNVHIFIDVFKIFPGGHTPDSLYWGWAFSQTTPLSPLRGSTWALCASAHSRQYLVRPFPTLLETSGKSQGISFGLKSGILD